MKPNQFLLSNLSFATVFGVVLVFHFTSCSRLLLKNDVSNTPLHCFDMMSQTVDTHYSLFAEKKVDWGKLTKIYRARVYGSMTQDSLFKVMSGLLSELNDGHVNLFSTTDKSRNWHWKQDFPDNYNESFVQRNYLKNDFKITGPFYHNFLQDSVGYLTYRSFSAPFTTEELDYILQRYRNSPALIIDLRDNGGGALQNAMTLMSPFFTKNKITVGYGYKKNGPLHTDFTKGKAFELTPPHRNIIFQQPVFVLINRGTYSAANYYAAFMSVLPNVTLIGDRTGGGGGIPISFDLPNGWQYRMSASYTTLPNGMSIEGGVAPDVEVTTGPSDELKQKDQIIERALELAIKKKQSK